MTIRVCVIVMSISWVAWTEEGTPLAQDKGDSTKTRQTVIQFLRDRDGEYIMNPDGTGIEKLGRRRVLHRHSNAYPTWENEPSSNVEEKVKVVTMKGKFAVSVDGKTVAEIDSPLNSPNQVQVFLLSPKREAIAFQYGSADGKVSVRLIDVKSGTKSGTIRSLGDGTGGCYRWSCDGSRLAYIGRQAENATLHLVNPDGSGRKDLVSMEGSIYGISWSPNGEFIAYFHRDSKSKTGLSVVSVDGKNSKLVAPEADSQSGFGWAPDGKSLVFQAHDNVWVVQADGSGLQALTSSRAVQDRVHGYIDLER